MSDDYDEFDDEFDSAFLNEIDAIEAAASASLPPSTAVSTSTTGTSKSATINSSLTSSWTNGHSKPSKTSFKPSFVQGSSSTTTVPSRTSAKPPSKPAPKASNTATFSDDFDTTFDIDDSELARLDEFIADSYAGKAQPVTGPNRTRQTTLDGSTYNPSATQQLSRTSSTNTRTFERTKSSGPKGNAPLFGFSERRTKVWDRTQFAETGFRSKPVEMKKAAEKEKVKNKENANGGVDEDWDEEIEFEQFPAPKVQLGYVVIFLGLLRLIVERSSINPSVHRYSQAPKMRLRPELLECMNWIYPLNRPRRDYQFNIARNCLFQNTLVALPTGLGKTFIAGVVMLNFYKWFPTGKIIFVAPTKPLVAQQITASHEVCGIPGCDAAELTGNVAKHKRSAAWTHKRVLYMTPQTFMNDIQSGLVDPLDIVLIVIDEAHRGTGDYAYALIVRYMMAHNPHFRVLALTATPGNSPEAVQNIVDCLHISHIEIRNEESSDLRQYIHKKEVRIHKIEMTEPINDIKKPLSKLMDPYFKRCKESQLLFGYDPVMLHPFSCQSGLKQLGATGKGRQLPWAYGYLKVLGSLARVMATLIEHSPRLCYDALLKFKESLLESTKPGDRNIREQIFKNSDFKRLLEVCEKQAAAGFASHPKMDMLTNIILEHFMNTESAATTPAAGERPASSGSRVMVFVQFRDVLDEVMEALEKHKPIIKPVRFVGQGRDKHGKKGMGQTEQLQTVKRFKDGEFNVLVATSIGEEGLDIGEIDRIVCYDTQKSSIRLLQRIGRTGRKRAGYVDVLLSDPRETRNWDKSQDNYTEVQQSIINGSQLELFGDVERLVPDNIQPECLQMEMVIEEYVPPTSNRESPKGPAKKRKRNDDINRNMPLGALNGFVTASSLRPKSGKAKKAKALKTIRDSDVEDDSDDEEIAGGIFGPMSTGKTSKVKGKNKAKTNGKKTQQSMNDYFGKRIPSQLQDDEDDIDILNGVRRKASPKSDSDSSSDSESSPPVTKPQKKAPRKQKKSATAKGKKASSKKNQHQSDDSEEAPRATQKKRNKWLFESDSESDDGEPAARPVKPPSKTNGFATGFQSARSLGVVELTSSSSSTSPTPSCPASPRPSSVGAVVGIQSSPTCVEDSQDEEPEVLILKADDEKDPKEDFEEEEAETVEKSIETEPVTDLVLTLEDAPESSQDQEASFVIRKPKRARTVDAPPSSPVVETTTAPRRIKRRKSQELMAPPPVPLNRQETPIRPRVKRPKLKMTSNPMLFDVEAQHSGDEVSDGSGSEVDMVEDESDLAFLTQGDGSTQIPHSYDQAAAYRMGLMTQAPGIGMGPLFTKGPRRVGAFAGGRTQVHRPVDLSSSPVRDSEPDEYEMGSFVVEDDDQMFYRQEQSSEA